jgi:hypothetical protein
MKALPEPPVGFIIITAIDSEKQRSIIRQFPDYPVFDKPMSTDRLLEAVKNICYKHKLVKKVSAKKAS